jgi:hypothetical protein
MPRPSGAELRFFRACVAILQHRAQLTKFSAPTDQQSVQPRHPFNDLSSKDEAAGDELRLPALGAFVSRTMQPNEPFAELL